MSSSTALNPVSSSEIITQEALITRLRAPFHPNDIEWRIAQSGVGDKGPWAKCFAYVDNRAIMSRLDDVFGVTGWSTDIRQLSPVSHTEYDRFKKAEVTKTIEGFIASISIRDPITGDWITKEDGANNTDFEPVKGGISGAIKRAAVSLGIGRYLYDLPEGWAVIHPNGVFSTKIGDSWTRWSPPALPAFALPSPDMEFQVMQSYLAKNYTEAYANATAWVGNKSYRLADLLLIVKEKWGEDYYLTLSAYEALRRAVG